MSEHLIGYSMGHALLYVFGPTTHHSIRIVALADLSASGVDVAAISRAIDDGDPAEDNVVSMSFEGPLPDAYRLFEFLKD